MLVVEVFRYLKRQADKRPVSLSNFLSMAGHHGKRSVEPKVSVIIPTRDKHQLLRACIDSIQTKTAYGNYEIVVINNGSRETATIEYLELLRSTGLTVLDYPHEFNYSKISNFGADNTASEYLCFLNNDTEVMEPQWLGLLMDHAVQPDAGVVGSKLLYPDGSIQHLGIALGYRGIAGHVYRGVRIEDLPLPKESCFEVSGVTFACALIGAEKFKEIGGLDVDFRVGLNDVDFSNRARLKGLKNIICSRSCLTHKESMSRKSVKGLPGAFRAVREVMLYLKRYPHFSEDFFVENESLYTLQ